MRAGFRLVDPGKMEAELTVRMSLNDWKEFAKRLPEEWPAWEYSAAIRNMILAAEGQFHAEGEGR